MRPFAFNSLRRAATISRGPGSGGTFSVYSQAAEDRRREKRCTAWPRYYPTLSRRTLRHGKGLDAALAAGAAATGGARLLDRAEAAQTGATRARAAKPLDILILGGTGYISPYDVLAWYQGLSDDAKKAMAFPITSEWERAILKA